MKTMFRVDPTNLDKSAAAAFSEHAAGRMSYAEWQRHGVLIKQLRGIEAFRRQHDAALHNHTHPEHAGRVAELQEMYEAAYPEPPGAGA